MYLDSKYIQLIGSSLRNFKRKDDYLWNFSCPICGDSQENTRKARAYVLRKSNGFIYYCHNCKESMSFYNFLKWYDGRLFEEYCFEKYKDKESEIKITKKAKPEIKKEIKKLNIPSIAELNEEHPAKRLVKSRKIPFRFHSILHYTENYKEWCDSVFDNARTESIPSDNRVVIPFYDLEGNLFASQGRALDRGNIIRYATAKNDERASIYGLDRWDSRRRTYIVEGPLDSLFLPNALAVTNSNLHKMIYNFQKQTNIKIDDMVFVFDNEKRNPHITKTMKNCIKEGHQIVIWDIKNFSYKDINDMVLSGVDVLKIIDENTHQGLMAELKFNEWKRS